MLKRNRRTLVITSLVILLPIFVGIFFWDQLPDPMATHFGTNNQANGYSGKGFTVFGLPFILLAIHWFCAFITSRDPRKENISNKIFNLVLWIVPLVSLFAMGTTYSFNLGYKIDVSFLSFLLIGCLFTIIGNFLPKARWNYTIGFKLPWTLANEENWNKTHRLAGYLWTLSGIGLVILALSGKPNYWAMLVIILVAVIIPSVYSFWLHDKKGL